MDSCFHAIFEVKQRWSMQTHHVKVKFAFMFKHFHPCSRVCLVNMSGNNSLKRRLWLDSKDDWYKDGFGIDRPWTYVPPEQFWSGPLFIRATRTSKTPQFNLKSHLSKLFNDPKSPVPCRMSS